MMNQLAITSLLDSLGALMKLLEAVETMSFLTLFLFSS